MNEHVTKYLTNDYIYIPYKNDCKLLIKDGQYVYKNDLVMEYSGKNIYSSVSGKVLGLTKIQDNKYIVIENDYKELTEKKTYSKKSINNYNSEDLLRIIKKYNIIDNFDISSKVLIINAIDKYNEEITNNELIKEYTIDFLDCIDALIEILNIRKCYLAVSNNDTDCINTLINNIGTYPKIELKLFTNDSIIGNKTILIDKLTRYKNKKYNVQYLTLMEVLNIYYVLKKQIPVSKTFITLYDKINNTKRVLHVNIGTNLNDILNEFNIENKDNVIINGLLNGKKIKDPNFIIDKNVRSIFINKQNKYKEFDCINCGMCTNICPININPKYMHYNKDNKSKKYREECINCGLCSYVCPSKINLNKGCDKNE